MLQKAQVRSLVEKPANSLYRHAILGPTLLHAMRSTGFLAKWST